MVGITIMVFLGFAGLAVDTGVLAFNKTWLQNTADASALAAVLELPDADPRPVGVQFADLNHTGATVSEEDVEPGRWDWTNGGFTAGAVPANAVRVTARESVGTIVMRIFGHATSDMTAIAIAAIDDEGERARFLVDDEMIDTDIPVIEDLARRLGKSPEDLVSDRNNDRFIDLPPGTQLELPTGQVGDEALFELQSDFPFTQTSTPYTLADFLRHQAGSGPIPDNMLDPLRGVRRVDNAGAYASFVDAEIVLVSPIYKSDVSALSATTVNAKGERRGLLAFSIEGIGADPDGAGSRLPNIIIRVRAPGDVVLAQVFVSPPRRARLVI